MSVFMCLLLLQCNCDCTCVLVYMSLYTNYSPLYIRSAVSPLSDVGALGVIGGGCCWRVAASLFGVVETIVVLVGAR